VSRRPRVRYDDAEPNGLAAMLGGLIQANLEQHPDRAALLSRPASFGIVATDAAVATTIRLSPGEVRVTNGIQGRPNVVVRGDSDTLMRLSSVPLRFGLPDAMTGEGRTVLAGLLLRRLRVKGIVTGGEKLGRLNRLLSVTS
jgi:hypothetical protein